MQLGKQTSAFSRPVYIYSAGCTAGHREGQGPLAGIYDKIYEESALGLESWEKAEAIMQKDAFSYALRKSGLSESDLRYILAGDLLSQCIGSAFGMRDTLLPFIGLYGACSTMAEGLALGAMLVDGGFADNLGVVTSSHFCGSERQFRFPLEYAGQRTPTAQWTVTGAGAAILSKNGPGPQITHVTMGKIVDMGIKDVSYLGAAMAPAAYDTMKSHLADTGACPQDYNVIVTGDLGSVGAGILRDLFLNDGIDLGERYNDCGMMIFDPHDRELAAGGSGCGCSAVVFCSHILNQMRLNNWQKVLFCGTGALFSPVSALQGESIPSVCHAVSLCNN
ncbi:MAG: stage V sporulation protein AD [Oscillospiraceae bacterium]|nr:stage V sporulation protein AD [Oscillospiraceae bacterium]